MASPTRTTSPPSSLPRSPMVSRAKVSGRGGPLPSGRCGAFGAFERFIATREEAGVRLAREGVLRVGPQAEDAGESHDGSPEWHQGPMLIFGRDAGLLAAAAKTALGIEGADFTAVKELGSEVKNVVVAGWAEPSTVHTFHVDADCDPDDVVRAINGALATAPVCHPGTLASVIYVRASSEPREDWAVAASTHEFEAIGTDLVPIAADFERLIRNLRCRPTSCLGPGTYFVSLTFPDLSDAVSSGEEWTPPEWAVDKKGPLHSALEVRADLLKSRGEDFVLAQLAIVRRHSQGLPIIYTVRSINQGGAFPDDEAEIWRLMLVGLRFGVEYVDVEACWSREGREAFIALTKSAHRGVRVIGSYHAIQRPVADITDADLCALFHECARAPEGGNVDIVKVVGRAETAQCSIRINQAAISVRKDLPADVRSIVAICTTDAGRLSRALNVMLGPTPVAHPALPGKAAPGQLSAVEIEQIRQMLGLQPNPFA